VEDPSRLSLSLRFHSEPPEEFESPARVDISLPEKLADIAQGGIIPQPAVFPEFIRFGVYCLGELFFLFSASH